MKKVELSPSEQKLFVPLYDLIEDLFVKQLVAPHLGNAIASKLFRAAVQSVAITVKIGESRGLSGYRDKQLDFMTAALIETYAAELQVLDTDSGRFADMMATAEKMRGVLKRLAEKGSHE
jgi:hypothetical protein